MRPGLSPFTLALAILLALAAALFLLALLSTLTGDSFAGALRCWRRGNHDPYRHPVGGFRCRDCGAPGATLHDLGFEGLHYVTPPAVREHRAEVRDTSPPPIATDLGFYRPARRRS